MFENPGGKIRKIAVVLFWITVVIFVIAACAALIQEEVSLFLSLLIVGPLTSYISTLFLVAFGELVQNISELKDKIMSTEQMPIFSVGRNCTKIAKTGAKGYAESYADSAPQSTWQV